MYLEVPAQQSVREAYPKADALDSQDIIDRDGGLGKDDRWDGFRFQIRAVLVEEIRV